MVMAGQPLAVCMKEDILSMNLETVQLALRINDSLPLSFFLALLRVLLGIYEKLWSMSRGTPHPTLKVCRSSESRGDRETEESQSGELERRSLYGFRIFCPLAPSVLHKLAARKLALRLVQDGVGTGRTGA